MKSSHQRSMVAKYEGDSFSLFSSLPYYFIIIIYATAYLSIKYWNSAFQVIVLIYAIIPLLDEFISFDLRNPTKEESKKLEGMLRFKIPLYLAVILDWAFTFWAIYYIVEHKDELSYLNQFGIIFAAGNAAASNINVAHELFHKDNWLDSFMGTFTLAKNLYMHFSIEHISGHHRRVATKEDPATSRKNQTLYEFIPQTIIGSYFDSWTLENKYQRLQNRHPLNINNKMIYYTAEIIILPLLVKYFLSTYGMVVFLLIAFNSVFYLEAINYIEHYGLLRKEISPGVYEKVDIHHSWNAPHRFSNYFLFKLQRHSDHHESGYKEYQTLCSYDESPTLPHGYTVCILLSFFPPIWFKIMNKVLERYEQNKKTIWYSDTQKEVFHFILLVSAITVSFFLAGLIF